MKLFAIVLLVACFASAQAVFPILNRPYGPTTIISNGQAHIPLCFPNGFPYPTAPAGACYKPGFPGSIPSTAGACLPPIVQGNVVPPCVGPFFTLATY